MSEAQQDPQATAAAVVVGYPLVADLARPAVAHDQDPDQDQGRIDAQAIGDAVDRTYHQDLAPVGAGAQRVYAAYARYAFDEPECWPSQDRIAGELGLARETVTRSVDRLTRAGWMILKERRWSWRSRWMHNVYELLAPFCVSELAARAITRRAHNTRRKRLARARARGLSTNPFGDDHTNPKGRSDRCSCRSCRPDRTPEMSLRRPHRPLDARERRRQEWADQDWKATEVIRRCRLDQRSSSLQQPMRQTTSERRDCAHGAIPGAPQVCNRP